MASPTASSVTGLGGSADRVDVVAPVTGADATSGKGVVAETGAVAERGIAGTLRPRFDTVTTSADPPTISTTAAAIRPRGDAMERRHSGIGRYGGIADAMRPASTRGATEMAMT